MVQAQRTSILQSSTKTNFPFSPAKRRRFAGILLGTADDNNEAGGMERKKMFARIGGRKKTSKMKPESKKGGFPWWGIPLIVLLLLKGTFSFGSDPSFVYYESSVYESRVYNNNGQLETSRKESFRSNIPGLVEQKQLKRVSSPEDDIMRRQEAVLDQIFR